MKLIDNCIECHSRLDDNAIEGVFCCDNCRDADQRRVEIELNAIPYFMRLDNE